MTGVIGVKGGEIQEIKVRMLQVIEYLEPPEAEEARKYSLTMLSEEAQPC